MSKLEKIEETILFSTALALSALLWLTGGCILTLERMSRGATQG